MIHRHVVAGRVPAIRRGTVLVVMAATRPATTAETTTHIGRRHRDLAF